MKSWQNEVGITKNGLNIYFFQFFYIFLLSSSQVSFKTQYVKKYIKNIIHRFLQSFEYSAKGVHFSMLKFYKLSQ